MLKTDSVNPIGEKVRQEVESVDESVKINSRRERSLAEQQLLVLKKIEMHLAEMTGLEISDREVD
jgi:hypothetical protein